MRHCPLKRLKKLINEQQNNDRNARAARRAKQKQQQSATMTTMTTPTSQQPPSQPEAPTNVNATLPVAQPVAATASPWHPYTYGKPSLIVTQDNNGDSSNKEEDADNHGVKLAW